MTNYDVVILGGGIAGLIAGHVLKEFKPLLIEAAPTCGGDFGAGLAYLHATTGTIQLVRELKIPYRVREVRGAMETLAKQVVPYPQWLWDQPQGIRELHQAAHWIKTRGSIRTFQTTCMNDPRQERAGGMRNRWEQAIHLDQKALIKALVQGLDSEPLCGVAAQTLCPLIDPTSNGPTGLVELKDGRKFGWTDLVTTVPLWVIRDLMRAWQVIPEPVVNRLAVLTADCVFGPAGQGRPTAVGRALLDGYDYVYTPFHPTMNRVSPVSPPAQPLNRLAVADMMLVAEFNWGDGGLTTDSCTDKLAWTVGASRVIHREMKMIPGHLIPFPRRDDGGPGVVWPNRVHPLGRFAEWDSRATADVVLKRAFELREKFRTWRAKR